MDEQRLQQILADIAQEEIPDDMNLWNGIQAQINQPAPRRSVFRISKTLALVAVLLISSLAFALYNRTGRGGADGGLIGIYGSDLGVDLNLSRQINGATISIPWAYADGNRIAVKYEIVRPKSVKLPPITEVILTNETGERIPEADFITTRGGGGGGNQSISTSYSTLNYSGSWVEGQPETLTLKLTMKFGSTAPDTTVISPEVTAEPPIEQAQVEAFEVVFDFEVPFIPAIKFDEKQEVMVNDVTMSINTLSVTPSITMASLCYDNPYPETLMLPYLNPIEAYPTMFYPHDVHFAPHSTENGQICGELTLSILNDVEAEMFTLTINQLKSATPLITAERVETYRQSMEEAGFEVNITQDTEGKYIFNTVKVPEGEDSYSLEVAIYNEVFGASIEGPWTFTFDLP